MRKLTIVLAVLMLFLQVFSCTVVYGADGDGNAIYIRSYTARRAIVNKDESVTIGLVLENTSSNVLTDIKIEVDGSLLSAVFIAEKKVLDKIEAKILKAFINVVYKGYGNELKINIKYNDGSGKKAGRQDHSNRSCPGPGTSHRYESICTQAGGGCRRNACDKCRQYIQIEIQDRQQKRTPS